MKTRIMIMAATCCLWMVSVAVAEVEPGTFELRKSGNRYWLEADQAPVAEVLQSIAAEVDIPVTVDDTDASVVTADLEAVNLEKLLAGVSDGYAVIYVMDEDTGEYVPEQITAAGQREAEAVPEDGLVGEAVVKSIMERAREIKRYHQKMQMSTMMMGQQMDMAGEMWMDGERMHMEMTIPPMNQKQIIVNDGTNMYTYMPMMNMVQKMDMKKIEAEMGEAFEDMGGMGRPGQAPDPFDGVDETTLNFVGADTYNGENVYVLEGGFTADQKEMMAMSPFAPETARFWVSAEDGLPRKSVYFGKEGKEMFSQAFEDVDVNPDMDESLFVFEPPEDAQVVDMTEGVINMFRSMQQSQQTPQIMRQAPAPTTQP